MKIFFIDETHEYFNESQVPYISVSGLAKKLEPQKDWETIKAKYAAKNGMTIEEVTADWENKKILGTQTGTIFHNERERELLAQDCIEYKKVKHNIVPSSFQGKWKVSLDLSTLQNNTCYPEIILYHHGYRLAGQSDKLLVTKGKVSILDYKTDKEISFKAFQSAIKPPDMLLSPVDHLEECNGNMYNLKMSLYMWMALQANPKLKPGEIILEHYSLERDMNGIAILKDGLPVIKERKDYKLPYLEREVTDILTTWKPYAKP